MKSYLKFLSRNKLYTAIEAVGLAVSLAFVILIGSYVVQQYEVAHESPQWKRTFVLGTNEFLGLTYWDKEELEMNIPEVQAATRAAMLWQPLIRQGDQLLQCAGMEADADFFRVFPQYRLVEGSAEDFVGKEDILISESLARKLAKDGESIIGGVINVDDSNRTIKGIYADFDGTFFMPTAPSSCPTTSLRTFREPGPLSGSGTLAVSATTLPGSASAKMRIPTM